MVKKLGFLSFIFALVSTSCSGDISESTDDSENQFEDLQNVQLNFEEKAVKELILKRVKLSEADLGTFEIHRAHLNADAEEDGYVVLNLAPKAKKDMENSSNPARFQDAGYIGDYNFIYVWDGKTKTLGTAFKLVGNGLTPLQVSTSNFLDPGYKSLIAEYRVQNSIFTTFFKNMNGQLIPVFSYTKVDLIGTPKIKVHTHKFQENSEKIEKDIVVVRGTLNGYNETEAALYKNDYNVGEITPTDEVIYHFFFDERSGKYATNAEK